MFATETIERAPASGLESALTEAVSLAQQGDWVLAEVVLHAYLRELPPVALPQAYITCVDLVARLLTGGTGQASNRPRLTLIQPAPPVASQPRLLAPRDPARNYAHAVLTALRGRLTG